ncbi:MAG: response regulator [Proteobacteria bacterium]|nr:response regulator [Pseudomonadota bacterium]
MMTRRDKARRLTAKESDAGAGAAKAPLTAASQPSNKALTIVGVGASAGGLEAFSLLLGQLDPQIDMAMVLLQHLDPSHHSLLSEILAKATKLPVVEVIDGMKVDPGHIYVMPPNSQMTVAAGKLRLTPRLSQEAHTPIDDFFYSLASECGASAIAVVLSGTGTDGAKGLAKVAAEGGATFAQEPQSAKFNGMPLAAIAAGAEHVLTPELIAAELGLMALHQSVETVGQPESVPPELPAHRHLKDIFAILLASRGTDFSRYKLATVQRRIDRRMSINRVTQLADYVSFLRQHPTEVDHLYEDILIKVSCFFRQPESFVALATQVLPQILREHSQGRPVRIWVPACATGEEAYSLAIIMIEAMEAASVKLKLEIFATDISDGALAKARQGYYDSNITEHVSATRLERFFRAEGDGYRVVPKLRDCCLFAKQDVTRDPPFSRMDVISCRNLLIYLTPAVQRQVLSTFHFALNPSGILTLGSSETIGTGDQLFTVTDSTHKIFARSPVARAQGQPHLLLEPSSHPVDAELSPRAQPSDMPQKVDLKSEADQAILSQHAAIGVVINSQHEVVQFRGDCSPYLVHPPGDVTVDIFKMCRGFLLAEVRTALKEAEASNQPIKKIAWNHSPGPDATAIDINVIPFSPDAKSPPYFILLFAPRPEPSPQSATITTDSAPALARLELELTQTKTQLNTIIEKEQTTNEELKSANEEILSANEELQSGNEEMAVAKEEVQAANEELTTLNDELEHRNKELELANSDLANLFGSIQIPIIILDGNLLIRRFTPAAEKFLKLSAKDIGQSLRTIGDTLSISTLPQLAAEVIDSLNTRELEVQDQSDRWYSLRIKPYRTRDNKIDGAIITLVDIDFLKRSLVDLHVAYDYAEAIIQTTPVPLLVLDGALRIVTANQAFLSHFRVARAETTVTKIYDLGNGQWNSPGLRQLLEEILPKNELMENFIVDHEFPLLGRRTMRLSARRLAQQGNQDARILLAIQDVTEQQLFKEAIIASKDTAEAASQSKSDFLANMSHEIRTPLGAILGYTELLANPQQEAPEILQCATRIRKNVEHLTELIDDVLDIAKIEAGKLEIEKSRFMLLPELAETIVSLRGRAESKGLAFDLKFAGDIPESICSCATSMRQVLLNIIGNAVKFTDHGCIGITVSLVPGATKTDAAKLQFTVSDSGNGLTEEQRSRLFKPFSQADNSVTRRYGGTGLGLILARHLAKALGGDVQLTESQIGKGSTFTITIDPGPLEGVRMLQHQTDADLTQKGAVVTDWFIGNKRLTGLRVLLAEDVPDNQLLIAHFIKNSGATIAVVDNGLQAVDAAKTGTFDVILMDIQMPLMDGYEATKQLRASGCLTPVIALTAHSMRGEREKCLAAGCVDYISKPVKPGLLIEVIARVASKTPTADHASTQPT